MGKIRGFLLKNRIHTIFRCFPHRRRPPTRCRHLTPPPSAISRLFGWTRSLGSRAKSICCGSKNRVPRRVMGRRGYVQIGRDPEVEKRQAETAVPKGYMAVYVGQKGGEFERVLVPVISCNHPLFGRLLREAEAEFGFNHPGAITIPCRVSEFEHVQTRIKQARPTRKLLPWTRNN